MFEGNFIRKLYCNLLTLRKCTYFGLVSVFHLIFNNVKKRVKAIYNLEFCSYFHGQKFRTTL